MIPSEKFGTALIKSDAHSTHQQMQSHFISKITEKRKGEKKKMKTNYTCTQL